MKDILVRAKVSEKAEGPGESSNCGGKRCEVCSYICNSKTFLDKSGKKTYEIKGGKMNCNSRNVVYMVQCKVCKIQYVGSACTKFRMRFNNYKACFKKYSLNKSVPQASFHAHFSQTDHNGMDDWSFTLIDYAKDVESVRRKESFWQYKLNSFQQDGLNERDVTFDFG